MLNPSMMKIEKKNAAKKISTSSRKKSNNELFDKLNHEEEEKIILPFTMSLHALLDNAEKNGDDDIISFCPDGTAFSIHKPKEFTSYLLPQYFKTKRLASFQRQLLLYGFKRIVQPGTKLAGYHHAFFVKGQHSLSLNITRKRQIVPRDELSKSTPASINSTIDEIADQYPSLRPNNERSAAKQAMFSNSSNPLLNHQFSLASAYQHQLTPSSLETSLSSLFPKTDHRLYQQQRTPSPPPPSSYAVGMSNNPSFGQLSSSALIQHATAAAAGWPSSPRINSLPLSRGDLLLKSRSLLMQALALQQQPAAPQQQQQHQPSSIQAVRQATGASLGGRRSSDLSIHEMATARARYDEEQSRQQSIISSMMLRNQELSDLLGQRFSHGMDS